MKLIEAELSMSGLGKRKGILNKLEEIVKRDWDTLDTITERRFSPKRVNIYEDKLNELKSTYESL